jgi:hypothetical protein
MPVYGVFVNRGSERRIREVFEQARKELLRTFRDAEVDETKLKFEIADHPKPYQPGEEHKRNNRRARVIAHWESKSGWTLNPRKRKTKGGGQVTFFFAPFTIRVGRKYSKTLEFDRKGNEAFVVPAVKSPAPDWLRARLDIS